MGRIVVHWSRARCFGDPIGPWRFGRRQAAQDLIEAGLGEFDRDGIFYATVPGNLEVRSEWMAFDEAEALSRSVKRRHSANHRKGLAVTDKDRTMCGVRRPRY